MRIQTAQTSRPRSAHWNGNRGFCKRSVFTALGTLMPVRVFLEVALGDRLQADAELACYRLSQEFFAKKRLQVRLRGRKFCPNLVVIRGETSPPHSSALQLGLQGDLQSQQEEEIELLMETFNSDPEWYTKVFHCGIFSCIWKPSRECPSAIS